MKLITFRGLGGVTIKRCPNCTRLSSKKVCEHCGYVFK